MFNLEGKDLKGVMFKKVKGKEVKEKEQYDDTCSINTDLDLKKKRLKTTRKRKLWI